MKKDELVHEIGAMLLNDQEIQSFGPWKHLVMIAQIMEGNTDVSGFVYLSDGEAVSAAPDNFDVLGKFQDLQSEMHQPGQELWKAALVRIDNTSKRISIDFEYDHPENWSIDPDNMDTMAEKLRNAS